MTSPLVRVSNTDGTTFALLSEWLAGAGYRVITDANAGNDAAAVSIVDVPFSRNGAEIIQGVAASHPGEPIIVLSATFLSSVGCGGGCARRLGVAGALPKPFTRAALLTAVQRAATGAGTAGPPGAAGPGLLQP